MIRLTDECPLCAAPVSLRNSRNGQFVGCTRYPACRHTEAYEPMLEELARRIASYEEDRAWFDEAMNEVKQVVQETIAFTRVASPFEVATGVVLRLEALLAKL